MTLTLRIDNYDTLDNGGPTWITLDQRGASVGRRASMDWVLPDPARHISGHHFDIRFHDGAYWLSDVSTNGTYFQGSHHRPEGPQRLQGGERLIVGHYVISVDVAGQQARPAPGDASGGWGAPGDDSDPWSSLGAEPLEPVNPLPTPAANPHHLDEVAQEFVPLQRPSNPSPISSGTSSPLQQPGFGGSSGADEVQRPPSRPSGAAPLATPQMSPPPDTPPVSPPPPPPEATPSTPPPPPAPTPAIPMPAPDKVQGAAAPPSRQAVPAAPSSPDAVIEAFCRGAGLSSEALRGVDPLILVETLGRSARISTGEIMRMLQDRASVKQFTRGGERTMRSAVGNNPMKFLPDAEQAFAAMFLQPREGFLTGPESYENALSDLRRHQMAVFAALQPALAEVLRGLSPDEIEGRDDSSGNLLSGSRKGRHWEAFVRRWDEKASAGEHGMLDAFLRAFARAYADAASKSD